MLSVKLSIRNPEPVTYYLFNIYAVSNTELFADPDQQPISVRITDSDR